MSLNPESRWNDFFAIMTGHAAGRFRDVDVRSPEEWRAGHVEGSVNVPLEKIDTVGEFFPAGTSLLVYGRNEAESSAAKEKLKESGYGDVIAVPGSFEELVARTPTLPVKRGSEP